MEKIFSGIPVFGPPIIMALCVGGALNLLKHNTSIKDNVLEYITLPNSNVMVSKLFKDLNVFFLGSKFICKRACVSLSIFLLMLSSITLVCYCILTIFSPSFIYKAPLITGLFYFSFGYTMLLIGSPVLFISISAVWVMIWYVLVKLSFYASNAGFSKSVATGILTNVIILIAYAAISIMFTILTFKVLFPTITVSEIMNGIHQPQEKIPNNDEFQSMMNFIILGMLLWSFISLMIFNFINITFFISMIILGLHHALLKLYEFDQDYLLKHPVEYVAIVGGLFAGLTTIIMQILVPFVNVVVTS